MEQTKLLHSRVWVRTIIISTVLLGSLLFALDGIFYNWLGGELSGFGRGLKIGLSLLIFWIVVTASLRSINNLASDIPGWKLLAAGVAIAGLGTLFGQFILQILSWFKEPWAPAPNYQTSLFYVVAGLVASIISLINLRVKDQKLGNILEVLFIVVVAILFFYFAR
jgi:hypothetical protein